jgi:hypothetical protein
MTIRTTSNTITFHRPFCLKGSIICCRLGTIRWKFLKLEETQ